MTDNTQITLSIDCYEYYAKLNENVISVNDINKQVENFHKLLIDNNVKDPELLKRKETIKLILHYLCKLDTKGEFPSIKFTRINSDNKTCDFCKFEILKNNYYYDSTDKVYCINCVVKYFVGSTIVEETTDKALLTIFTDYNCDIINSSDLSKLKCPQCNRKFTVSDIYMNVTTKKIFTTKNTPYCLDHFINDKVSMGYKRKASTRMNKNSKKSSKRRTSKRRTSSKRKTSKRKTSKRKTSKRKSCKIRSRRKLK